MRAVGIDHDLLEELREEGMRNGVRHVSTWLRYELYRIGYGRNAKRKLKTKPGVVKELEVSK